MPHHRIDGAAVGMRVARWWETFPGFYTPMLGTIIEVREDHLLVEFDALAGGAARTRLVSSHHLTEWTSATDPSPAPPRRRA